MITSNKSCPRTPLLSFMFTLHEANLASGLPYYNMEKLTHFIMWCIWQSVRSTMSGMVGMTMTSSATAFDGIHSTMNAPAITRPSLTLSYWALAHSPSSSGLLDSHHSPSFLGKFHSRLKTRYGISSKLWIATHHWQLRRVTVAFPVKEKNFARRSIAHKSDFHRLEWAKLLPLKSG